MQVETEAEFADLRANVEKAEVAALDQPGASCCYARSDKYLTADPQGGARETFRTLNSVPVFGNTARRDDNEAGSCCVSPATIASKSANTDACCP